MYDLTKRFWLLAGFIYYPDGGLDDLRCTSDTLAEIARTLEENDFDWYHVIDTTTMSIVDQGGRFLLENGKGGSDEA